MASDSKLKVQNTDAVNNLYNILYNHPVMQPVRAMDYDG